VLPSGDIAVDAVMDLDASADENRWLVLLGDSGAAAVRLLPGGVRPESLALGASDVESAAPGFPALYSLRPGASGLAAIRADCDNPLAATLSLVAADGMTVVVRAAAGAPLPFAIPGPAFDGGAAFLAIESTVPTTCTAYHIPWLEFDRPFDPDPIDLVPNDDLINAESIRLGPSPAYRHLARLDAGYDIDRYRIQLTRPVRIEVAAGQPQDFAARAEFVLEVTDPEGTVWTADPWDAGADGIASLAFDPSGADDTYDIAVRAIVGSHGPYVLSIHEQVLIDEVDLWSGGIRFVELAGPPGLSVNGWQLVHRSAAGDQVAATTLSGVVPADGWFADGRFVVAADLALPGADAEWAALDAVTSPATLALLDDAGHQLDAVGFGGATAEGGSVVPPETPTSLGRCLRTDSYDNATDFWRQHGPTPHAANECEFDR
jgi:hypothetical protein